MQSSPLNRQSLDAVEPLFGSGPNFVELCDPAMSELSTSLAEPAQFRGQYVGRMDMNAAPAVVAQYLDAHSDWFHRCAHPMTAEPLGSTGYALVVGRFGSFGYEVEPKVGLDLLPPDQGVYRIETIPVPGYEPQGYDVDFRAAMELHEGSTEGAGTQVEWDLDLKVSIHFPRFIQALPKPLIQTTGDRLLNQIVRQVSRRLTYKVQEDFHLTQGLPLPATHKKRYPWSRKPEISIDD